MEQRTATWSQTHLRRRMLLVQNLSSFVALYLTFEKTLDKHAIKKANFDISFKYFTVFS